MIFVRLIAAKAGSIVSLPFLLLALGLWASTAKAADETVLTFQKFESSCIDLGHYDSKIQKLTVRFANRKTESFYRYSNVPERIWKRLRKLNESGGVGNYLHETVLADPKKFPYQEVSLREFQIAVEKKKAGDPK